MNDVLTPAHRHQLEVESAIPADIIAACDQICPPGSAVANFHNSAPWMKMQIGTSTVSTGTG